MFTCLKFLVHGRGSNSAAASSYDVFYGHTYNGAATAPFVICVATTVNLTEDERSESVDEEKETVESRTLLGKVSKQPITKDIIDKHTSQKKTKSKNSTSDSEEDSDADSESEGNKPTKPYS